MLRVDTSSLFPAIGALLAGAAVIGAAVITSGRQLRQEEQRSRVEREQWRLDAQREAYVTLLGSVTALGNRWWELVDVLHRGNASLDAHEQAGEDVSAQRAALSGRAEEAYQHVLRSWDSYTAASAVARMQSSGHPEVVAAIDTLRTYLDTFDGGDTSLHSQGQLDFRRFDELSKNYKEAHNQLGEAAGTILRART
jgi:hypothetical protein